MYHEPSRCHFPILFLLPSVLRSLACSSSLPSCSSPSLSDMPLALLSTDIRSAPSRSSARRTSKV
eukprot:590602-Hanusia_phi.AAC.1